MRCAVCQPTYLPWCGYLGMIHSVDCFISLDDVQFEKQSWQQRNRIKGTDGQSMWLTVPVMRRFGQKINEVQINTQLNWQKKHVESIRQAYSKAPYWDIYFLQIYDVIYKELVILNIALIGYLSKVLGLNEPLFYKSSGIRASSEAVETNGTATDRLIMLLQRVGATEYLANPGSMEYLGPERDKFDKAGITLKVFNFKHPVYPQIRGGFISHLSVIDLLFNTGNRAIDYIKEGCNGIIS